MSIAKVVNKLFKELIAPFKEKGKTVLNIDLAHALQLNTNDNENYVFFYEIRMMTCGFELLPFLPSRETVLSVNQ